VRQRRKLNAVDWDWMQRCRVWQASRKELLRPAFDSRRSDV